MFGGSERGERRVVAACVCVVVALVLPACGGGDSGGESESKPSGPPEKTSWQKVLDGIQPDGTVPLETALQAFSLAVGPLPGVSVPDGRPAVIPSASGAIRWVRDHWAELTPEQQTRASELVPAVVPTSDVPPVVSSVRALGPEPPPVDSPGADAYRPVVDQAITDIKARIPSAPTIPDPVIQIPGTDPGNPLSGNPAYMGAAAIGASPACVLYIFQAGEAATKAQKRAIITHEVFHCFQIFIGVTAGVNPPAPWIHEGGPTWVMDQVMKEETGTASDLNANFWDEYLYLPEDPLFGRAYDAIGFYGHLDYVNVDVWSVLLPMVVNGTNEGAFTLAAGSGAGTTTDWPSGFFRGAVPDKPWDTDGPGITDAKPPPPQLAVANGQTVTGSVAPVTNAIRVVDLQADFVLLDIQGDGHLRDSAGDDTVIQAGHGGLFCALPDQSECVCPPGSANEGRELGDGPIAQGKAEFALSGALPGGAYDITGRSKEDVVEELCNACTIGTFVSTSFGIDLPAGVAVSGGTGAVLVINGDGTFTLDYTPMSAATIALPGFSGTATIAGQGSGTIEFFEADDAPEGVEAGTLQGSGSSDAIITAQALGQVFTFPVGAGAFTGPYSCTEGTLMIDLYGGHWTFQRT